MLPLPLSLPTRTLFDECALFQAARELAAGTLKPKVKKVGLMQWALEKNPIGLNILFKKTREMVAKQVCLH